MDALPEDVIRALDDLAKAMVNASLTEISPDMQVVVAACVEDIREENRLRNLPDWGSIHHDATTGEIITPTTYTMGVKSLGDWDEEVFKEVEQRYSVKGHAEKDDERNKVIKELEHDCPT